MKCNTKVKKLFLCCYKKKTTTGSGILGIGVHSGRLQIGMSRRGLSSTGTLIQAPRRKKTETKQSKTSTLTIHTSSTCTVHCFSIHFNLFFKSDWRLRRNCPKRE